MRPLTIPLAVALVLLQAADVWSTWLCADSWSRASGMPVEFTFAITELNPVAVWLFGLQGWLGLCLAKVAGTLIVFAWLVAVPARARELWLSGAAGFMLAVVLRNFMELSRLP